MAQDHRKTAEGNTRVPFSCQNRRFQTNLQKGFAHAPHSNTLGSVLKTAPIDYGDYSLWLEHVIAPDTNEEVYLLMWYGNDGLPTIPLSGVFGKADLEQMASRLISFVP